MTTQQPGEAAEALAMVDQARARSARASQAPWWADALCAVLMASAWALVMAWRLIPAIIAVILFVTALLVNRSFTRRKGRVLDDRATNAGMGRYFLFMAPVMMASSLLGRGQPLWVLLVFALAAAVLMFAYLRAEVRYQSRRLTAGDFKPWDLV